jgi:hypothetical protein
VGDAPDDPLTGLRRTLERTDGRAVLALESMASKPGEDEDGVRCADVVDWIPAGSLEPGEYRFTVTGGTEAGLEASATLIVVPGR